MERQASGALQLQFLGSILNVISSAEDDTAEAQWGEAITAIQLTTGVEDGQINRAIGKRSNTLASGGILTIDVYDFAGIDAGGGLGRDKIGQEMALDEIVGLLVVLKAGSAGGLAIGAEGSGAAWNSMFNGRDDASVLIRATSTIPGIFLAFNPNTLGWTVADVVNHLLKFEAVGGDVDFSWVIIGRDNP